LHKDFKPQQNEHNNIIVTSGLPCNREGWHQWS